MNTTKLKRELLAKQWTQRFVDFKNSGLSLKEWLAINNLSKDQFYYWKRKLSDKLLDAVTTTTFVSLPQIVTASESTDIENTPLLENSKADLSPLPDAILNINGIEIKLFNSTTPDLLKTVFEVINHA